MTLEQSHVRVPAKRCTRPIAGLTPRTWRPSAACAGRFSAYQEAIRHHDVMLPPRDGIELGLLYRPIRRVGVCIPGGRLLILRAC